MTKMFTIYPETRTTRKGYLRYVAFIVLDESFNPIELRHKAIKKTDPRIKIVLDYVAPFSKKQIDIFNQKVHELLTTEGTFGFRIATNDDWFL